VVVVTGAVVVVVGATVVDVVAGAVVTGAGTGRNRRGDVDRSETRKTPLASAGGVRSVVAGG
jgi:hypothetical protein